MLSARHPSSDGKRGEMPLGMFADVNAKSSVFYGKANVYAAVFLRVAGRRSTLAEHQSREGQPIQQQKPQ